jgi:RNA polymerase sigma-70 factor, ECF subfamily
VLPYDQTDQGGRVDQPLEWLAGLYRQNRRQLYLIAWSVLRQPELAEDAVHAAFVGLARLAAPPREPRPYAFRAVRNAAVDLLAARARRREEPIEAAADPPATIAHQDAEQLVDAVRQAIERLEPAGREAIELHLKAGLTFQEIADLTGEPLSTVSSRYRRALARIREQCEVHHG